MPFCRLSVFLFFCTCICLFLLFLCLPVCVSLFFCCVYLCRLCRGFLHSVYVSHLMFSILSNYQYFPNVCPAGLWSAGRDLNFAEQKDFYHFCATERNQLQNNKTDFLCRPQVRQLVNVFILPRFIKINLLAVYCYGCRSAMKDPL